MSTEHPNTQKTEHGTLRFFLYLACLTRFDLFRGSRWLAPLPEGPGLTSVRVAGTYAGGCEPSFSKEPRSIADACVCALLLLGCSAVVSRSCGMHPLVEAPAVPGSSLNALSLSDTRSLSMSLFSGGCCYLMGIQRTAPKMIGSMSPSCNAKTYCVLPSAQRK